MRIWDLLLTVPPLRTLRGRFIVAIALAGPVMATIRFGEVVARKSLDASPLMVAVLTMVMPVSNLAALWAGRMLTGRDQRPFILIAGVAGGLALISGEWLTSVWHLFAIYIFFFLPLTVQLTGQNRILQQHVASRSQGGVFGTSNGFREAFAAIVSVLAGAYMDRVLLGYQHVFLVAGIFMIISTFVFATMPTKAERSHRLPRPRLGHVTAPLPDLVALLRRRPDFLRFEGGFMVYGFAFMSTLPVVPILLVDELGLDYTTIGLARGTLFQLTIIPSIWIFGRLFDRIPVHLLASRVFTLLALFPLALIASMLLSAWTLPLIYLAFMLFGLAMGGIAVLWNISSVRFAGDDEDAGLYQSVHLAATGLRGLFAPLLAYAVMRVFGTLTALTMAAVLWLLAGLIMRLLHRRDGWRLQEGMLRT